MNLGINLNLPEVAMGSSERPSSERYFRQGKMVVPDLCFNGLPGYIYTDATCLAALLLLYEKDRRLVEESCKSLFAVLELFNCDAFNEIIYGRLFHHHHNPTLAGIMAHIGLQTIVIIPDPATVFSNLSRPRPSHKPSTVASCLKCFKEWLELVPMRETYPHLIVLQAADIANNPIPIASALTRLELIHSSHSQSSLDRLYRFAKCMTPDMMELCYGEDFQLEPEFDNSVPREQQDRIKALTEQHPIANEIKELHREVTSSLQAC